MYNQYCYHLLPNSVHTQLGCLVVTTTFSGDVIVSPLGSHGSHHTHLELRPPADCRLRGSVRENQTAGINQWEVGLISSQPMGERPLLICGGVAGPPLTSIYSPVILPHIGIVRRNQNISQRSINYIFRILFIFTFELQPQIIQNNNKT